MGIEKFSKKEAIQFGWQTTKSHLGFFMGISLIAILIVFIPNIFQAWLGKSKINEITTALLGLILNIILSMGLIKISLKFCDNQNATWGDLFSCSHLLFKFIFGMLLYGLIVAGGMILLIIPGIIWSMQFFFFRFFIIDKEIGAIDALKRSSLITKGKKWDLLVFILLLGLINLLGILVFLIGILVTIPTTILAVAFVYRKLSIES